MGLVTCPRNTNFATLRSLIFVISQHVTLELGKFTDFKAFFPNCFISSDKKPPRDPMTYWILGRATNWFWSLKKPHNPI